MYVNGSDRMYANEYMNHKAVAERRVSLVWRAIAENQRAVNNARARGVLGQEEIGRTPQAARRNANVMCVFFGSVDRVFFPVVPLLQDGKGKGVGGALLCGLNLCGLKLILHRRLLRGIPRFIGSILHTHVSLPALLRVVRESSSDHVSIVTSVPPPSDLEFFLRLRSWVEFACVRPCPSPLVSARSWSF